MVTVKRIRILSGILVCCFLFTSIISHAILPLRDVLSTGLSKKLPVPVSSDFADSQLFDEEEGEEKSEKDFGNGGFHPVFTQTSELSITDSADRTGHDGCFLFYYPAPGIPLYLSKRAFLL